MKRLLAMLLAMGVLVASAPDLVRAQDDKKDEKKKDEKKEEKKEEKKAEEKLTDAQKDELKKLSGTFTVTAFERDGEKYGADKLKKMKVVQKGGDYTFHDGDDVTIGKDTVFPDKDPKECDSVYLNNTAKGEVVKGIYKIDNETVTYCWADPKKDRPKSFETKKDSGLTLMTLKRVEEKADKKEEKKDKKEGKKEEKKDDN
ncbi:MAG: TIGR03067 domain-containing protein [Gemmataceae bacterium]